MFRTHLHTAQWLNPRTRRRWLHCNGYSARHAGHVVSSRKTVNMSFLKITQFVYPPAVVQPQRAILRLHRCNSRNMAKASSWHLTSAKCAQIAFSLSRPSCRTPKKTVPSPCTHKLTHYVFASLHHPPQRERTKWTPYIHVCVQTSYPWYSRVSAEEVSPEVFLNG